MTAQYWYNLSSRRYDSSRLFEADSQGDVSTFMNSEQKFDSWCLRRRFDREALKSQNNFNPYGWVGGVLDWVVT